MGYVVDLEREVVLTEDLVPVIEPVYRRRIENWKREWPNEIGKHGRNKQHEPDPNISQNVSATGAIARICFEAGIPPRGLSRILAQETSFVDLDIADRLLMALDLTIHDVPVYKAFEVRKAVKEQTELIKTICRATGRHVPEHNKYDSNRTSRIPNLRKQLLAG